MSARGKGWTPIRSVDRPCRRLQLAASGREAPFIGHLGTPGACPLLLPSSLKERKKHKKKIDIARIPELKTSVGLQGSVKHKEVGGPVCLGALLGVALMIVANG